MMTMENKSVVNGVYEHINNGGVEFSVTDAEGPTVEIKAWHFGNMTNHIKLHVTKESLHNLAQMFAKAAEYQFGPVYVCASDSYIMDKETGKTLPKEGQLGDDKQGMIAQKTI
jgi:hypothetical protein